MDLGKTLVIQAYPGFGDMMWYMPYVRALAAKAPGGKVSLLTKSRTMAKDWLGEDPAIDDIFYFERRGLLRSVPLIKEQRFKSAFILHRSFSYGAITALAGVPNRYGFGFGKQKWALSTKTHLDESMKHIHTIDQVRTLFERLKINYDPHDYALNICPKSLESVNYYFKDIPKPWIVLGIGGSENYKKWPQENFVSLALYLNREGFKGVFFCGGPQETDETDKMVDRVVRSGGSAIAITDYPLKFSMALTSESLLYIGNDTGLLNVAGCSGCPALGLFGATPVLDYSPTIHGIKANSMEEISTLDVMEVLHKKKLLKRQSL